MVFLIMNKNYNKTQCYVKEIIKYFISQRQSECGYYGYYVKMDIPAYMINQLFDFWDVNAYNIYIYQLWC